MIPVLDAVSDALWWAAQALTAADGKVISWRNSLAEAQARRERQSESA